MSEWPSNPKVEYPTKPYTDGFVYHYCCIVCGKMSPTDMLECGGEFLEYCPSRRINLTEFERTKWRELFPQDCGDSLPVCKAKYPSYESSECRIKLEKQINKLIDVGFKGFPVRFP